MIFRDLFLMEVIRPVAVLVRRLIGLLVMLALGSLLYSCVTDASKAPTAHAPVVFRGRT